MNMNIINLPFHQVKPKKSKNSQVFVPGSRGPSIQPHLQSVPEVANSGWRDYGNRRGLQRLVSMFKDLGIPATAVINSEATKEDLRFAS